MIMSINVPINVLKHEYETDSNCPLKPLIWNIRTWPIWILNYGKLPINRPYMSYLNVAYMASRRNGGYKNRTLMCHSRPISGGYRGYFLLRMWLCCHIKLGITHGPNCPVWSLSISIVYIENIKQGNSVLKCIMFFRSSQQMLDVRDLVRDELPSFSDPAKAPYVRNH